jgi:hypothetical protein
MAGTGAGGYYFGGANNCRCAHGALVGADHAPLFVIALALLLLLASRLRWIGFLDNLASISDAATDGAVFGELRCGTCCPGCYCPWRRWL